MYRPFFVWHNDPGTLFVGRNGGPLQAQALTNLVGKLTAHYGGLRIQPATIRKSFGFCWLRENPDDYYTLSRVFGHSDIRTTIRVFGHVTFSRALSKVEQWVEGRIRTAEGQLKKRRH